MRLRFAEVSTHSVPGRPGARRLTAAAGGEGGEQGVSEKQANIPSVGGKQVL